MIKSQFILILFFVFSAMQIVNAQESKLVIINLKTGYSVKGEIVEQTAQSVKIKTSDGQIFEYRADEVANTEEAKISSGQRNINLPVETGDLIINAGFALLENIMYDKLTIPAVPVSFEYIVTNNLFDGKGALGCGGYFGYSSSKDDYYSYGTYKNSKFIIGARGYFHYALVKKLDTYGGVLLGYKNEVSLYINDEDSDNNNNKLREGTPTANVFVGSRYFFNDRFAGMAELAVLGWGMPVITLGVSVRL